VELALFALGGELGDRRVPVDRELLVGRGDGCDLMIKDPRLSRRHARFYMESGRLYIEDLGSPNGTFVNQKRVKKEILRAGDIVSLGKTQIAIEPIKAIEQASNESSDDTSPDLVKPIDQVVIPSLESLLTNETRAALIPDQQTLLDSRTMALERVARHSISFAVLHEIGKIVQTETEMRPMLAHTLDVVLTALDGDRAYVALLDETNRPNIESVRHRGISPSTRGGVTISHTLAHHIFSERAGVISSDVAEDERFRESASIAMSDARSLCAVPIVVQSRALGLLAVESGFLGRKFVESDLDLMSTISATVAVALANIEKGTRLRHAEEELRKAEQLAMIGRVAAGIAHEVKNHLSPFMLADMIAREYPNDQKIRSAAEVMLEAQQHILDLVNEIRAAASGNSTAREVEAQDLAAVTEGVFRFMQCDAKLKRVRKVQLNVKTRPIVWLNARSMRQVLVNLLRNAADAVVPDRGLIQVEVSETEELGIVEVKDNGHGIPPEVAERIFEPFFSTKGDQGMGLGLDISRKLIVEQGGDIEFSAEPGGGTKFRVILPKNE
jgi:signal transduction histidine kinase/pSer/pThr/pTyr-binding forkhead associated (FHA) protein